MFASQGKRSWRSAGGPPDELVEPHERNGFNELPVKEHYLHSAELVGEQLRYIAESKGKWLALLMWNAAAFNLRDREAWIGWSQAQNKRHLTLVVNNSRFVILPEVRVPNLASRVMKLCLGRLSADWLLQYGHEVLMAESFVDSQLFQGTCYKACGWTLLGQRQGYARARQDYYVEHQRPKQLWVRDLRSGARTLLRGHNLPTTLKVRETGLQPVACRLADDGGLFCRAARLAPSTSGLRGGKFSSGGGLCCLMRRLWRAA